jgi:creatinine amidohydrolase
LFPGTRSLSFETLARLWYEICHGVDRAGLCKAFFNSHGGQPQVMEIVCRELRVKLGMFAVSSMWWRFTDLSGLFDDAERRHGIHTGVETSVMMRLHPELVDISQADDFVPLSVALERANAMLTPEGGGWLRLAGPGSASQRRLRQCGRSRCRARPHRRRTRCRLLSLIDEIARDPIERVVAAPL